MIPEHVGAFAPTSLDLRGRFEGFSAMSGGSMAASLRRPRRRQTARAFHIRA